LSSYLPHLLPPFEKTTLYIACHLIQWNPEARDHADPEASSTIEWLEPNTLISIMQEQGIRFQYERDADESEMVKRAIPFIQQKMKPNLFLKAE